MHQENQSRINIHYFFEELYTRKYDNSSSMADHIAVMLDLKHRITQAGEDLPDIHVARAMILSLPKTQSWEVVKITLFEIEKLTSELVSSKLLQEANCRTREKSSDTVLMTRNTNQKGKGRGCGSG